jgi:glutamyl endopeptidase
MSPFSRSFITGGVLAGWLAIGVPSLAQPGTHHADPRALVFNDGRRVIPPQMIPPDEVRVLDGAFTPAYSGTGTLSPMWLVDDPPAAAPGTESIIGTDDRKRVMDTTQFPYRAIVHITANYGGCTGFLIDADTVATAGHCVYNNFVNSTWQWASNVRVYPGRNDSYLPYGGCGSTGLLSAKELWTVNHDQRYDYGMIKLACTVGTQTGWIGMQWTSTNPTGMPIVVSGYPNTTQYYASDQIREASTFQLFYAADTNGGQSGGPVYVGPQINAVGIHTAGISTDKQLNRGVRVTQTVYDDYQYWKGL